MYAINPFEEIEINHDMVFCMEDALGNQSEVMMQHYVGICQVITQASFDWYIQSDFI